MSNKYLAINLIIFASLFITVELRSPIIKDAEVACYFHRAGYKICKSLKTMVKIEKVNFDLDDDQELDIVDKSISSIKPGAFNNLNITKLSLKLTDGQLDLKPDGFVGLSKLESLEINSGIVSLEPRIFAGLESLRSLTLTINGARQDFKKSLPELVLLENLTIINSNMMNINLQTFFKLYPAINKLDLSSNNITKIGQGAFSTLNSITNLIINNNKLTTLQQYTFTGLVQLSNLELSSNQLKTIEKNIFNGLYQLTKLDLSENKITDISSNAFNETSITHLSLAKNELKILKPEFFYGLNKLKIINLDYNHITYINDMTFSKITLEKLSLRHNSLQTIDRVVFRGLVTDVIDLSFNRINGITMDAFKNTTLKSLILSKDVWGFTGPVNIIVT
ncbi:toll-like receptor 3 [Aphidius gifuensis]|uniref:toll-like receptor 3 n=1 Tax=Aphidius gifuensis TaxID=684658 RepID=UPI001CDC9E47|nr:toll-like receptor 3 [Aphidius gifuensis]